MPKGTGDGLAMGIIGILTIVALWGMATKNPPSKPISAMYQESCIQFCADRQATSYSWDNRGGCTCYIVAKP